MIYYEARDEEKNVVELSLLNDWDLDAAFLSFSRPFLVLKIQLKLPSSCKYSLRNSVHLLAR